MMDAQGKDKQQHRKNQASYQKKSENIMGTIIA